MGFESQHQGAFSKFPCPNELIPSFMVLLREALLSLTLLRISFASEIACMFPPPEKRDKTILAHGV